MISMLLSSKVNLVDLQGGQNSFPKILTIEGKLIFKTFVTLIFDFMKILKLESSVTFI
jgi:hypothetical protein